MSWCKTVITLFCIGSWLHTSASLWLFKRWVWRLCLVSLLLTIVCVLVLYLNFLINYPLGLLFNQLRRRQKRSRLSWTYLLRIICSNCGLAHSSNSMTKASPTIWYSVALTSKSIHLYWSLSINIHLIYLLLTISVLGTHTLAYLMMNRFYFIHVHSLIIVWLLSQFILHILWRILFRTFNIWSRS